MMAVMTPYRQSCLKLPLSSKVQRIISLLPSTTEVIYALGCGANLVGRSHECDYPSAAHHLPICSTPKFNPDGTSYALDQRLKALLQEGLAIYRVDAKQLDHLAPDLIVTQAHCEVCAVELHQVEQAVHHFVSSQPRIVAVSPNTLADIWQDIHQLATALDVPLAGAKLCSTLQQALAQLATQTKAITHQPSIACIEWIDPLMGAGNWMPELVKLAGGHNIFGNTGTHSPWLEWQDLLNADPEVILIAPCGFSLKKTRQEIKHLKHYPNWSQLQAVAQGRVYLADGNQYFNRPGPRVVESVEILAEILHGDRCRFGHNGTGWELLD